MSGPMEFEWTTPRSPPFDISKFDPKTLSEEYINTASLDPDLCPLNAKPALEHATSRRDWVRRNTAVKVSPSVLALGKNPYPGLKFVRKVPGWNMYTPEYDYSKPWFGESQVLKHLTPAKLLELGCINTDTSVLSPISRRYRIDTNIAKRANKSDTAPRLHIGNHDGIHAIVRRNNFNRTSDYEYECLKPTLRIVTKFLEMDSVLDMLWALGQRWTQVRGTKRLKDVYVYYTGRSTPQQRQDTALELVKLAAHVCFEFVDFGDTTGEAKTTALDGKPGLRAGTTTNACQVEIDDEFLYAIADGSAVRADLYNPAATHESSFLRTQLWLATTIIHELGHVFRFNTHRLPYEFDPFCNDNRIAEEGHDLEAAVHKGVILTANHANLELKTTPFGMSAWEWPGIHEMDNANIRRTFQEDGLMYTTCDMMNMEYIRDFFSDDFWNDRYLRYGMSSFKAVGVRFRVADRITAQSKKRVATMGLELEAEKWMPEVERQGIVYKDKVLNLAGDTVIATKTKTPGEKLIDDIAEGFIVKDVKKLSIGMKTLAGKSPITKKKWPKKF